ncbi:Stk1 family PASTA domain-containing Ser/Thr kinase [Planococcus sp. ISL-109]|uniref:Stk1 family PASTA domain-containing Ser/Thr kinase n=1 Tax=Planococcus sp. ISL-109 TaxID=2819166 RepID=UPI001BEAE247|nr:Stk1 family PASTA domain-containing Ser/Thr kinase [Planococcus sp. ISL-109]MBT2581895.1 Stk1 family PASTA domain-containing Ser/Thr kinase [Planococcus sp. ISL-109]
MLIGKRINGRYKVLEAIGSGGMSNVYLAHDMILDRDVAIKVLRYDFSNEEELRRRFQREALSTTSLDHPNIVTIFDVGEENALPYLVMEYVPGDTLKEYIIKHSPVEPERAVEIMKQLASALAHAHHNHIVHRDIKPQNVLVDGEGNVKISDFGIAMALSATSYTQTNSVLGTVHYLSPEQARGGTANKKSDIYSLGIVMFELLTGRLPFSGESAVAIALKHLQTETPSLKEIVPSLPQSLENIVLKATTKNPQYRYASADEMAEDLSTALSPERLNEPKFAVPIDEGETRAMPAIKDSGAYEQADATKTVELPKAEKTPPVKPLKKKERKKLPIILGIFGALLLAGLIIAIAFPGLFEARQVAVPDVSGMERAEAQEELMAAGFIIEEETEEFSEEVEADHIIRTIPEAGKMRDRESGISLFVSAGKETAEFGDYVGTSLEQAQRMLESANYAPADSQEEFSDEATGTILSQSPEAGTEVVISDTEVAFVVSKGKDMREVSDLSGFGESELNEYARSSGFNIRIVREETSETVEEGLVLSQNVASGEMLEVGSTIEVVLSSGGAELPVKTYVETVEIPYEPAEPAEEGEDPVEQTIRIYIQDQNQSMVEPVEEFTITETTEHQIEMQIVEDASASYRIVRDATIILENTVEYENVD